MHGYLLSNNIYIYIILSSEVIIAHHDRRDFPLYHITSTNTVYCIVLSYSYSQQASGLHVILRTYTITSYRTFYNITNTNIVYCYVLSCSYSQQASGLHVILHTYTITSYRTFYNITNTNIVYCYVLSCSYSHKHLA